MKKQDFTKMTEDELMESHFDSSIEISHIMRTIIDMKRRVVKLSKHLDNIDLEMESRESARLGQENRLN